jgi:hypothetical protein
LILKLAGLHHRVKLMLYGFGHTVTVQFICMAKMSSLETSTAVASANGGDNEMDFALSG